MVFEAWGVRKRGHFGEKIVSGVCRGAGSKKHVDKMRFWTNLVTKTETFSSKSGTEKRVQKRAKKAPKKDPTCGRNPLGFWKLWPPLRKEKQYVKARIKCSGIWHAWRCKQRGGFWRPKRLQNRSRKLQKLMLENNTFLTSIFEGFGHRFGCVFGTFGNPKSMQKTSWRKVSNTPKVL